MTPFSFLVSSNRQPRNRADPGLNPVPGRMKRSPVLRRLLFNVYPLDFLIRTSYSYEQALRFNVAMNCAKPSPRDTNLMPRKQVPQQAKSNILNKSENRYPRPGANRVLVAQKRPTQGIGFPHGGREVRPREVGSPCCPLGPCV